MNENTITKLTVTPLQGPKNGVVAVATATFYDAVTINSITVNQGKNGLFVRMPQKKTQQGQYIDIAHPLSSELRKAINSTILNAYQSKEYKQQNSYTNQINIEAQNCVKYEQGKYGNALARMDIVFGDMVIHNAKLINNTDNKPFVALPLLWSSIFVTLQPNF
jgi:DNA-binding cell septation regulator SpoVG